MKKLMACMVVIYNPSDKHIKNLLNYAGMVEKLYVIDNSDNISEKAKDICKRNKIQYLYNGGNRGIAYALNRGAAYAYKEGYKWLLTMDQDSRLSKESHNSFYERIADVNENVAIVAMNYHREFDRNINTVKSITIEKILITSGSAIRLDVWKKIGGFTNKLFIDSVDHDYVLKVYDNGYIAIRINNIYFEHKVGNKIKNGNIITYNYYPTRYYYIVRNIQYILKKYNLEEKEKDFFVNWRKRIITSALREKGKIKKIVCILQGYLDFLLGRYGKYEDNWK